MIFEWMLYSTLAAAGFSVAALVAERVLLRGRAPVRFVWSTAMVLSLFVPVVSMAVASAPKTSGGPDISSISSSTLNIAAIDVPRDLPGDVAPFVARQSPSVVQTIFERGRRAATRLDVPLAAIWAALTLVLSINVLGGGLALSRMRRRWRATTVLNVPVLVSENVGPAVVGMRAPIIVIPEWVLQLVPTQLALLLQHENEHRRARDGQLLGVARLAFLLMPWNVMLLWQIRRLRVAVELDCDARVLSRADAREYGDLLLRVARAGHGSSLAGATAFAERATQLERRIRVLARHRRRASRASVIVTGCIGMIVLSAAWVAPHPDAPSVPLSALRSSQSSTTPMPDRAMQDRVMQDGVMQDRVMQDRVTQPRRTSADSTVRQEAVRAGVRDSIRSRLMARDSVSNSRAADARAADARATDALRMRGDSAPLRVTSRTVRGDTLVERDRSITFDGRIVRGDTVLHVEGAAIIRPVNRPIDSVVAMLLSGLSASPEQTAGVRNILLAALDRQQFQVAISPAIVQRTFALISARDSAFRALLTNEEDRARFDALASQRPGLRVGGAREGGAREGGAREGGAREGSARVGGAGARRGGAAADSSAALPRSPDGAGLRGRSGGGADAPLARVFDGINLSAAQLAEARTILQRTQSEIGQLQSSATSPAPLIGVDAISGRIAVSAPYSESILTLFSDESSRKVIRSRLALLPP